MTRWQMTPVDESKAKEKEKRGVEERKGAAKMQRVTVQKAHVHRYIQITYIYCPLFCCNLHTYHRRRNRGGWGGGQYFTLETLLIFIHAVQIAAIAEYITFGPPKMELLPTPMHT